MNDNQDLTQQDQSSINQEPVNSDMAILLNLETLIKSHISGLEQRKAELKKLKEMMASAFKNDSSYQDAEVAVKEANKQKRDAKARLMKLPEVRQVQEKVNELTTEIKDMDTALSDYLREYQRLSGSNEIVDDQGQVHEITYIAKLIKKGK
ncbi:MAG: hypothetical protein N3A54_00310 [Patescibacteria group bacterium]|nr:hypothetical protein [Patescibacteria group bacterium]